jgi:hypothetical protein
VIPGFTIVLIENFPGTSRTRYNPQKDNIKENSQQGLIIFFLQIRGIKTGIPLPLSLTLVL